MSRLLRSLEDEGLVETTSHEDDARRRVAKLTRTGRREFAAYEALSNAQAESFLSQHSQRDALLAAMDLIASALTRERVALTEMDPHSDEARHCLGEYYAELGRRFKQGFDVSLREPGCQGHAPSAGHLHRRDVGHTADRLRGPEGTYHGYAEIKRLWVAPAARGLRLGRRLMDAAEDAARGLASRCCGSTPTARWPRPASCIAPQAGPRFRASTMIPIRTCSSRSGCDGVRRIGLLLRCLRSTGASR